jgi:hypothetical protein
MKALFILLILALGFGLYLIEKDKVVQFREQVLLADGRTVEVDREFRGTPLGEIGGPGGWETVFNSFTVVDAGALEKPPAWEDTKGYLPVLLDFDLTSKEWTLLVSFDMCDAFRSLGKPNPPYAQFVAKDGHWVRIPYSGKFVGRETNLLSLISYRNELSHHSMATKRERTNRPGLPEKLKTIVQDHYSAC